MYDTFSTKDRLQILFSLLAQVLSFSSVVALYQHGACQAEHQYLHSLVGNIDGWIFDDVSRKQWIILRLHSFKKYSGYIYTATPIINS